MKAEVCREKIHERIRTSKLISAVASGIAVANSVVAIFSEAHEFGSASYMSIFGLSTVGAVLERYIALKDAAITFDEFVAQHESPNAHFWHDNTVLDLNEDGKITETTRFDYDTHTMSDDFMGRLSSAGISAIPGIISNMPAMVHDVIGEGVDLSGLEIAGTYGLPLVLMIGTFGVDRYNTNQTLAAYDRRIQNIENGGLYFRGKR